MPDEHRKDGEDRRELQEDRYAADQRRQAEEPFVAHAHDHPDIGEKRLQVGAGDVAEIFDDDPAVAELAAPGALALLLRDEFLGRLGGRHQHHVVIDLDRPLVLLETEQAREFHLLAVPSATEEADVAVVLERGVHLDRHERLGMAGAFDLVARHLDEVRPAEHVPEGLDQVGVGGAHRRFGRPLAAMVRIEIVVSLLQALELGEIFEVKDGAEQPAELAPRFAAAGFSDLRLVTQPARNVALACGNEMAARLARPILPCRANGHALSFPTGMIGQPDDFAEEPEDSPPAQRGRGPRSGGGGATVATSPMCTPETGPLHRFAVPLPPLRGGGIRRPTGVSAPSRLGYTRRIRRSRFMPQHSPVLAVSSWSVHRALGIRYPNAPANDVVAPAEETWGPGKLTLMELPRAVAEMGIDRLHICHFHLASRDPAYLAEVRAALADAGVSLETLLIDDGDIAHPSDRRRDIAWIGRWIGAAAALGAKRARVIGGKQKPSPEALDLAVAALGELASLGKAEGVRVITENWLDLLAGPREVAQVLDRLGGEVGLLADFGNWKGPRNTPISPPSSTARRICTPRRISRGSAKWTRTISAAAWRLPMRPAMTAPTRSSMKAPTPTSGKR